MKCPYCGKETTNANCPWCFADLTNIKGYKEKPKEETNIFKTKEAK